jgi:hypothetical protein
VTIDPQTTLPAAQDAKPGGKKSAVLAIGIALGIAALGTTGFVMTRTATTTDTPENTTKTSAEVAASAAPTVAPVPTLVAVPVPSASAAVADKIKLSIQATPANLDVFLGTERLGAAPGPIDLPRGDAPLSLTFSAKGYQSKNVPITPSQNLLIPISLDKSATTVKPPPTNTGKSKDVFYDD